jgi:hypothetical protein
VADELTKALLLEEVVSPSAVADALFASVTGGVPLVQALIDAGAASPEVIHRYLSRTDVPYLRQISPVQELVERLPPGMCARLFAVPVRRDAITGTVDVAVADARDAHAAAELSFHLRAPVRVVRAPAAAIDEAVRRIRMRSLPPPAARTNPSYTPPVAETGTNPRFPMPPQLAPPSDLEPLYDSRPRASTTPGSRRVNTLPPPVFEHAPISVPPASPPHPGAVRGRRDTPTWGTPIHSPAPPKIDSEAPKSGSLGSEIPIPLTRKTFTVERGGTQRPPPILQGGADAQLGEGIPVDPASYRTIVEVRAPDYSPESRPNPGHPGDASFIPGPPPMPAGGAFAAYAPNVAHPAQSAHYADVGGVLASLRIAQTRDEILELVLTGARMLAFKIALFVVKRGGYLGWSCTPELGDRVAIQNLLIPLESGSIFDLAVQEGLYLGPIRQDHVHMGLLHVMRGATRDVAAVPIRVAGKTAVIILADELGDTMIGTRRLEEIARGAGDAFARIVKMKR